MKNDFKVIIIGSGFGGQLAAINLNRRGISDYRLLERREFMGGTWAQNSYPGAAVDVPSPLYSLSFEPYDWTQLFADQAELQHYTDHIIEKHGIRERTLTNANVSHIAWNEADRRWDIQLDDERHFSAQFVINATGPLSSPVIPDFPGKERFKGAAFHSNHWDHSVDYKDKRVAVIGSGASAAQIIPAIAPDVEQLHVFQRTPHWVMPRHDHFFKSWQRALLKHRWLYNTLRLLIYWWFEFRVVGLKYSDLALKLLAKNKAEKHIRQQIQDPELQRKVTPDFTIGCKRVILSDTLYPAYSRQNVTVYDKNYGIREITEKGIVSQDGIEHALDIIVYCTGYDATDGVISYPVIGREGKALSDVWRDYPRAYLGTTIPGFPNLFIVTGPNTGIGHTSALFIIESQMFYIMQALEAAGANGVIEVKAEAEARYTDLIHKEMAKTVWHRGGCNSWYKSKSGKVIAMFPGFSFTYRRWTRDFKPQDHLFEV
jgi:cation diffusion facilitator CzcD-associated flavoprotein CzcO